MRFLRLDLLAYGPFRGVSLDLSAPSKMVVVFGDNEAGKSTTLRAALGLLYGIPNKTGDAHVHKMGDLRIGARIAGADGVGIEIVRRKGNANTLLDPQGQVLDDAVVRRLTGGLGEEAYASMFGLDHETLREGAQALLLGKGDVGESLFEASLGGNEVHAVLDELRQEADKLFTPQARSKPLNEALRVYVEAQKTVREKASAVDPVEAQTREIERETREREDKERARAELSSHARRLGRTRRVLPLATRRGLLLERRAALGTVVPLPESAAAERTEAVRDRADSVAKIERLARELDDLEARRALLRIPESLVDQAEAIEAIRDRLAGQRKALLEGPRLQATLEHLEAAANDALVLMGSKVPLAEASRLRVESAVQARIQQLALLPAALREKQRTAARALAATAAELERLRARHDAFEIPAGVFELRQAVGSAQPHGDLEERLAVEEARAKRLEDAMAPRLASLGPWSGTLAAARALRVPAIETIEAADRDWSARAQSASRIDEAVRAVEDCTLALTRDIDALERTGKVPTEEDLFRVRAERDRAWARLRGATRSKDSPTQEADFEDKMAGADEIADRLRREAERVAALARLLADRDAARAKLGRSLEERAVEATREKEAVERWLGLWAPSGIVPLSPAEMRGWIGRHAIVLEDAEKLAEAEAELSRLGDLASADRSALTRVLGSALAPSPEPLGALLARARERLAELERAIHDQRENADAIARLERERDAQAREKSECDRELSAWNDEWERAMLPLGLTAAASAEEATTILAGRAALFQSLDQATKTRTLQKAIERDAQEFAHDVTHLAGLHAPDLAPLPALECAAGIIHRYTEGREARIVRTEIDEKIDAGRREHLELEARGRSRDEAISVLMGAAGATTVEELVVAEDRASEARRIDAELAALDERLADLGEGLSIDLLIAQTRGVDPDHLSAEIEDIEAKVAELGRAVDRHNQDIGGYRSVLDKMLKGDSLAADSATLAQEALARLRGHVDRYVRVRLAGAILGREIERYRERNQGPVLALASERLCRLTLGSFASLKVAFDEKDRAVLRCVRPDGGEVPVEGLSDGTRDQLYLALRLASLERRAEVNDPMPLLLDDILVHFDDDRARAALGLLAALAKRMQVLFFTHHARLVALAREAVPSEDLAVIELASRQPAGLAAS